MRLTNQRKESVTLYITKVLVETFGLDDGARGAFNYIIEVAHSTLNDARLFNNRVLEEGYRCVIIGAGDKVQKPGLVAVYRRDRSEGGAFNPVPAKPLRFMKGIDGFGIYELVWRDLRNTPVAERHAYEIAHGMREA